MGRGTITGDADVLIPLLLSFRLIVQYISKYVANMESRDIQHSNGSRMEKW